MNFRQKSETFSSGRTKSRLAENDELLLRGCTGAGQFLERGCGLVDYHWLSEATLLSRQPAYMHSSGACRG